MLSSCPHRSDWSGFFLTVSSMQVPRCVLNYSCLAVFLHREILFWKPSIPANILFRNNLKIVKMVKYLSTRQGSCSFFTCHLYHSIWNHSPCLLQCRLEACSCLPPLLSKYWTLYIYWSLVERFMKFSIPWMIIWKIFQSPHFTSNL